MSSTALRKRAMPFPALLLWALAMPLVAAAQGVVRQQQAGPPPPPNGRMSEPVDLTGYWVAVVTEDWRYRMITADKGDFPGVALNAAGRELALAWDPARDEASGEQCKAYGAGAIMRMPTRLHITWTNDNQLRVDTDAGTQTRLFNFNVASSPPGAAPSWQGYSVASWEGLSQARGYEWGVVAKGGAPSRPGYLKVVTTGLRAGYLRKNGVPYSAAASVEESFDSFKEPNGDTWLVVTAIVSDPVYLNQPFITSSHFKKLADASGWQPTPCTTQ
jgi:hypothetical protein